MKGLFLKFAAILLLVLAATYFWSLQLTRNPFPQRPEKAVVTAVLFNGDKEDGGWNEAHYQGFEEVRRSMKVKMIYREHVPDMDDSALAVIDELVLRLGLNLKVYQPSTSPAWLEARHGRLWEQGVEGIERYNALRKGEPMQRALQDLGVGTWFAGLRRDQARSRRRIQAIEHRKGRWKVHPIFDWSDRQVFDYLRRHDLPYHPLWHAGYVSIGDWHTTRSLAEAGDAEATRFFGLKRECGLHGLEG